MAKYDRRKQRNGAIGDLNGLAEEAGLDKVEYRAGPEAVADLYVRLAAAGQILAAEFHEFCLSASLPPRKLFEASSEPSLHQPFAPFLARQRLLCGFLFRGR